METRLGPDRFSPDAFGARLQSHLHDARTVLLTEGLTPMAVERVTAQLADLARAAADPVRLIVGAPDGDAEAGLALYDAIRFADVRVCALATGRVGTAGALAYLAAAHTDRYLLPNGRFLLERPAPDTRIAGDVEAAAAHAADLRTRVGDLVAERTKQPRARVEADLRRGLFLDARQAVAYGLAARVVTRADEMP